MLRVSYPAHAQKRMSSEISSMWQPRWADQGNVSDIVFEAEDIIECVRGNWANGVTYMSAIITLTDGTFCSEPVWEVAQEVGQWVKENIDNPDMFGCNKNVLEGLTDKHQGKQLYSVVNPTKTKDDMILSTARGKESDLETYRGMDFITPSQPLVVTALGRYMLPGNSGKHIIRLNDQRIPMRVLREAVIDFSDPSTYTLDENGFAYAPIEPIELNQNAVYYVLSTENDDLYARPNLENIYNNFNVLTSSGTWTDISGTRIRNAFVPGPNVEYWPYLNYSDTAQGGGLVDMKVAIFDGDLNGNLANNAFASMHMGNMAATSDTSAGAVPAQWSIDGDMETATLAGDGNWSYSLRYDFGSVKKGINEVTVHYNSNRYATEFIVRASTDGKNYQDVVRVENLNPQTATVTFAPIDARYIAISTVMPAGATDPEVPGVHVRTAEVEIKSDNTVIDSSAQFVSYDAQSADTAKDDLSFASFAIDDNGKTVATAKNAGSALKLNFNELKEISSVDIDTDNTNLELLISQNGKNWVAVADSAKKDENSFSFTEPVKANYMLIRSTDKTQVLSISDIYAKGVASGENADIIASNLYTIADGFIRKIEVGTTVNELLENVTPAGGDIKVYKSETAATAMRGTVAVGTGNVVKLFDADGNVVDSLTVVILGDVSGDGKINATDLISLVAYIGGSREYTEAQTIAANLQQPARPTINAQDLGYLKDAINGTKTIVQK